MKLLITLLLLSNVNASYLPTQWYVETENKKTDAQPGEELSKYLEVLLNVQEKALNVSGGVDEKSFGIWKVSGQKTDLAVSKTGLFGFSSVKGTSAVELSWSRKKEGKVAIGVESDISLSSDMDEDVVLKTVRPVFKMLFKNKSSKSDHIQKNMEDHVLRYHRALKGIQNLEGSTYTPKKFRLDLSTSFSSPLFGFTKLSGDTRVRLEWKIETQKKKSNYEGDQEVVNNLMADISKALESSHTAKGYKLKEVSIGLGLSKKNLLSFSNVKGEIVGELYFKRNSQKSFSDSILIEGEYSIRGEEKFFGSFKRRKFRKGIEKSFRISNWFASKFENRHSQWEISKFKTSFSLSFSGFFGLANTSSKGLVTFTYGK